MRVWNEHKRHGSGNRNRTGGAPRACARLIALMTVLLWFAGTAVAATDDFEVVAVNASFKGDHIMFHAELKLALSDKVAFALERGITLHIGMDIALQRVRKWFWDKNIQEWKLRPELRYHTLSGRYLARYSAEDSFERFFTLGQALDYIGHSPNLRLNLTTPAGSAAGDYKLRVRAHLASDKLPGPLRLWSYVAPSWRLGSGWSAWMLRP